MEKYKKIILNAYEKLKSKIYIENTLIHLKKKIYDYENSNNDIYKDVCDLLNIYNTDDCYFDYIVSDEINILFLPKKIIVNNSKSNDENIEVGDCVVNKDLPVIDCPIPYYVIDIILSMYLLKDIDYFKNNVKRHSYTYTINENFLINNKFNLNCKLLLNKYSYGYSAWYNRAKKIIIESLERDQSVIVFKEDYKNFYFNNQINFDSEHLNDLSNDGYVFLNMVKIFINNYTLKLREVLKTFDTSLKYCVPVGFTSSLILAELMAEPLDKFIINKLYKDDKFLYYGRYADDMLFIFKYDSSKEDLSMYLRGYNKFHKIINTDKSGKSIIKDKNKIEGSIKLNKTFCASIVDFNDNIDVLSSADNDSTEAIDSFIVPNTFKLRRMLIDEYIGYSNIEYNKQSKMYNEMDRIINQLFCNKEGLIYFKLWIDIVKYLKVRNNDLLEKFKKEMETNIEKIKVDDKLLSNKQQILDDIKNYFKSILEVAYDENIRDIVNLKNNTNAIIPTFFETILNNYNNYSICNLNKYRDNYISTTGFSKKPHVHVKKIKDIINIYTISNKKKRKQKNVVVGLLMNKISDNEIIETISNNDKYCNEKMFEQLKYVFREAFLHKVDYLIAHECYLPYKWINVISYLCNNYKMSFICGLQYENYKNTCKNQICVIQYVDSSPYDNVIPIIREKNRYSFHEDIYLTFKNKDIRVNTKPISYVIHSNSINYTTFLCYELTNIIERSKYYNKVDCVFVPVLNRDTEYFDNIIHSYTRDLSAFIIQSNSTIYSGNAIYAPYDSNNKIVSSGKGGDNNRIIVSTLNIHDLRFYKKNFYNLLKLDLYKCSLCKKRSEKCLVNYTECFVIKNPKFKKLKPPCR